MFELRPYRRNDRNLTYNPFKEMEDMERAFFHEPFNSFFHNTDLAEFKTDILDEGDHYTLQADLPGFDKKDIHLDLDGDTLTVSAERTNERKSDENSKYVYSERSYGRYSRSYDVSAVDADNIKAKYDNGVLTLTMPKKQPTLPQARQLTIE